MLYCCDSLFAVLVVHTDGGNGGDLDDIINDLCALEAELADAQKEFHTKQPLTDGDSGNVDDMSYSPASVRLLLQKSKPHY